MSSKVNEQASSASTKRLAAPLLGQLQPPSDTLHDAPAQEPSSKIPLLQKNACLVCRRRKLRCDGETPACGRCTRLNHECVYNESRRRSGPKRGYVKGLEARLAQVEELLKKYEAGEEGTREGQQLDVRNDDFFQDLGMQMPLEMEESLMASIEEREVFPQSFDPMPFSHSQIGLQPDPLGDESLWAMIELGVEEPLPTQETIDELTQIYFTKIHPSAPIVHQPRFLASKPPPSLRYAIFAHAACITPSYHFLHSRFYTLALKYANQSEVSATNRKQYINIHHVQAWILIALYAFKNMLFPNAWMTTGRAVRIAQMLGLHRIDGQGVLEVKRTLRGVDSPEEKEERRRVFWMAFCMDRYAAVGTGWPLIVDERDIVTNVPCSEEAFCLGLETPSISLAEAMSPAHASSLSPFAGCVVVASLTGRVFQHLHRPTNISSTDDEFWRTHRSIDNTLLNMSLYLPPHLRLPAGSSNPSTIFLNMSLQSAVICLHQAAIFKAENGIDGGGRLVEESKERCLAAAMQMASIMKSVAHLDLSMLNVYTPFSLYVAARIFGSIAKNYPDNEDSRSSHLFLLSALVAIRDTNPLAESYLIQLDLEGFGLSALQENVAFSNLAQSVGGMNIQEQTEDSEWITFVSPLVRIVEQKEEGSPEEVISQPFRGESMPSDVAKGKMVSTTEEVVLDGGGVSFDLDTGLFEDGDGIDYLGGNDMSGYS